LRDSAHFEPLGIKIGQGIWISVRASEKNTVTRKWHFTYLPTSYPWMDFYQM